MRQVFARHSKMYVASLDIFGQPKKTDRYQRYIRRTVLHGMPTSSTASARQEALCPSSRTVRSSPLPPSSQRRAAAASLLPGADIRDPTWQPPPLGCVRSAPTAPALPWQCLRYAGGARGGRPPGSRSTPSWRQRSRRSAGRGAAARARCCGPGEARREDHPDTAAPVDCGASLAARTERRSRRPARGLVASPGRTARLRRPSQSICSRSACCARPRHAYSGLAESGDLCVLVQTNAVQCALHPQPSARPFVPRAAGGRAAPAQAARSSLPASRLPCLNCAVAAAAAAPPRACSDCACLPAVPGARQAAPLRACRRAPGLTSE